MDVATFVPLVLAVALSSAAPTVAAPPPFPSSPPAPLVDAPTDLPPRVPGRALPPPPAREPTLPQTSEEVSLGAGFAGSQANVIPRQAGARVAISPDDVAVWAPPPAWAPPPFAQDRYEGSEEWRTIHLGLALAVESILAAVAIGLVLSQDPDVVDDGRLAPATQSGAFFPR